MSEDCKCDARWSGKDEAFYRAAGCPNCTCNPVKLKEYVCDWCNSTGTIIGDAKSFPGTKTAKCNVCHHEWETR